MLLVLLVWDVHSRPGISEFFGQPKVDNVDDCRGFADTHDEIGWLDVSVDQIAGVDEFYAFQLGMGWVNAAQKGNRARVTLRQRLWGRSAYQLVCNEKDGLEREMFVAHLEEVFQRGAKEVKDHDIEITVFPRPHNPGYTGRAREGLVYLRFLSDRTVTGDCWLEFDSDLLPGDCVSAEVY